MRSRKLPPLKSLVYFEASARLQSFTAAAAELNVTQGAVSRQIRQLEETLGRLLFKRDRRQIALTDDGHNYFVSIVDVLDQLSAATERLSAVTDQSQVTVVTSSALASMYLLPKIPAFRRAHPEIQIRIVARDDMYEGMRTEHDLSLYYSRESDELNHRVLFTEEVFPVCSPDYFSENKLKFGHRKKIFSNLIWLESAENWINWPEWLERMSLESPDNPNCLVVNHYSMVIQAAITGQGIALAWKGLVDQSLQKKRLIKPTSLSLKTEAGFILDSSRGKQLSEQTKAFSSWLLDNRQEPDYF